MFYRGNRIEHLTLNHNKRPQGREPREAKTMQKEREMTHLVDARLVSLAKPFMGVRDARSYLNGVHIRPAKEGGAVIEATNGHTCVVIHQRDAMSGADSVIIKGDVVAKLPKTGNLAIYSDESLEVIASKGDVLPVYSHALNLSSQFPDIPRVFPDFSQLKKGLCGSAINSKYILQALAFFSAYGGRREPVVNLFQASEQGVALMCDYRQSAFVLIMPCRDDFLPNRPSWLESKGAAI
jgi:hypothetical protein